MAFSQLRAKYTGSLLGVFWAVINPLLMAFVITFIFTVIFKAQINNFSLFVFCGILPWLFFSSFITESNLAVLNQRSILKQYKITIEILLLSSILENFLKFFIGWLMVYSFSNFVNCKDNIYCFSFDSNYCT